MVEIIENFHKLPSFYSKLVRLKDGLDKDDALLLATFLFQIGSIKSPLTQTTFFSDVAFLFQIGSIKRYE